MALILMVFHLFFFVALLYSNTALILMRLDSKMQWVLRLPSGAVRCYSHPPDEDDQEAFLRPRDFSGTTHHHHRTTANNDWS
jgi:hypothetical protein